MGDLDNTTVGFIHLAVLFTILAVYFLLLRMTIRTAFPEAQFIPDHRKRRAIQRQLVVGVFRARPIKFAFRVVFICMLLAMLLKKLHLITRFEANVLAALAMISFLLICAWWSRAKEAPRRRARRLVTHAGVPVCIHCGYDLRGQVVNRCSECGETFPKRLLQGETTRVRIRA